MFNFIDNYTFIPVSGCVGMCSSAHCFARGPKMPIPRHYSYGPGKLNIILTQLRCNASFLNYDLCKVKILSNASCNCGAPCENSHHFFFDCDKYTDNREIIFNSLNWLPSNINIDVNLLTKGSDLLTYEEYITIFRHAFKYIKDSKRFAIV